MPARRRFTTHPLLSTLMSGVVVGCAAATMAPPGELRVLVQFGRSVDAADPEILRRLSTAAGTTLRLSSLLSDTEAAYWLRCTVADPNCFSVMGRLTLEPLVTSVQPDRYRYPEEPPR